VSVWEDLLRREGEDCVRFRRLRCRGEIPQVPSETLLRKNVRVVCNFYYDLMNAICPVRSNAGLMIVGRIESDMIKAEISELNVRDIV
jgi:hypothetical protein